MNEPSRDIPEWLTRPQGYEPLSDRDSFITRNLLAITSTLALFRLDDGRASRFSASAPIKIVFVLVCILLVSLSRNFLFVMVLFAGLLIRAALLPRRVLGRVAAGSCTAAALALLVMLPAALIGQPRSALTMAGKAFVSTGITLTVALTTPAASLTRALRLIGMPGVAILTIDLTLRSIVRLGEVASEVLCALGLRSVGRNPDKRSAMGGVAGVVLVKAARAAQDTHDAMRCRGFDGTYRTGATPHPVPADILWLALALALIALFVHTQGMAS